MTSGMPGAESKPEVVWSIHRDTSESLGAHVCELCGGYTPSYSLGKGLASTMICESCAYQRVARWLIGKTDGVPQGSDRTLENVSNYLAFDYAVLEREKGREYLRIGRYIR